VAGDVDKHVSIYEIRNLLTGARYIGQTGRRFDRYMAQRRWLLRRKTHPNKRLQAEYNQYGAEAFQANVLAKAPVRFASVIENYFMGARGEVLNGRLPNGWRPGASWAPRGTWLLIVGGSEMTKAEMLRAVKNAFRHPNVLSNNSLIIGDPPWGAPRGDGR